MTMIISCISKSAAIQVSDRRLTTPEGEACDDASNKAICLRCNDAQIVFAHSGLASIGKTTTEVWIRDSLLKMRAGLMNLPEICNALKDLLDEAFRRLVKSTYRRLTVHFVGYRKGVPVWARFTNHENEIGGDLDTPLDHFVFGRLTIIDEWPPQSKEAFLSISGETKALPAFESIDRRIKKRQRRLFYQGPKTTARELISYIRAASKHKKYGKYIGRNCTAVIIQQNGAILCKVFPEKGTPKIVYPSVIQGLLEITPIISPAKRK